MKAMELLAPVGSPEALDAAITEGADAIYLGLKNFNARLRTSNFSYSQFEGALKILHRQGRRLYVTVNTVFEQREADRMYQLLQYLANLGPDGLIVQDFGVAKMVKECFSSLKLHASTQMNVASARGANLLSKLGFSRVVLSRELDLEEIRAIRENTGIALEVFVHGALCISESGLCLFSSYLGGKSANRGMCTQACRRFYKHDDESGYYFSPADLQLVDMIGELADMGVESLKIEGRMKSAEYVGTVVSAYRHVLDGLDGDRQRAVEEAKQILRNDFARSKTTFHHAGDKPVYWLDPDQSGGTGLSLGQILKIQAGSSNPRALVLSASQKVEIGDTVRFHRADDTNRKSHKLQWVEAVGDDTLWISVPPGFGIGDSVYLIQTKSMTRRYPPLLPKNLSSFRKSPGRDTAPALSFQDLGKNTQVFPEGFYAAVSHTEDLYILQSTKPIRVILALTHQTITEMLEFLKPLPFSKGELIIQLDPFYPQESEKLFTRIIPRLLELGYTQFIINNLAHYSFFRGTDAKLIAGPYLYTFNSWSYGYITDLGSPYVITPLENNRQNLERSVPPGRRSFTFVSIFAYPALFRIRSDLSSIYSFRNFTDAREEGFLMTADENGARIFPERPFSIVDKTPFLKEAGFSRFILDFTGPRLRKNDYKDVIAAVKGSRPLPNTTRFNWKDGFYTDTDESGKAVKKPGPQIPPPQGLRTRNHRHP